MKLQTSTSFIIPANVKGKAVDLEEKVEKQNNEDAKRFYSVVLARLQHPNEWKRLAGVQSASFKVKKNSISANTAIGLHDYIRIDIPGPGPTSGDGYDWVRMEAIGYDVAEEMDESFGITVKACADPEKPSSETAHFFSSIASSTFIVGRKGTVVYASYFGRNEVPNVHRNHNVIDKIRNAVVAVFAQAGVSEMQWSSLLKGLLTEETKA